MLSLSAGASKLGVNGRRVECVGFSVRFHREGLCGSEVVLILWKAATGVRA